MDRESSLAKFAGTGRSRRKEKSCIRAAIMECLQLSVNKEVPKTILQCNNPSRRGNRQSFPRSLASFTFTDPDDLKIQRTSKRIVFPLTNKDFSALADSLLEPFGEWLRLIDREDQKMLIGRCYTSLYYCLSTCFLERFILRGYKTRWKETTISSRRNRISARRISYFEFCLYNPFFPWFQR